VSDHPGHRGRRQRGPGPAAHRPPGHRDRRGTDQDAQKGRGGGTGGEQPDDRTADPGDRLQSNEDTQRDEPAAALQNAACGGDDRQRYERGRQQPDRGRVADVQQAGQRRIRGQGEQGDEYRGQRAQPEGLLGGVGVGPRQPQRDAGLCGHRRHGTDQQDRHQRAQFAERRRCENACGGDREQVARAVAAHQGGRDQQCVPPRCEPDTCCDHCGPP
jgi:hypothetical protein